MDEITDQIWISDIQGVRQGNTQRFDSVIGVCQDDCGANVGGEYYHFNMADGVQEGHVPGNNSYVLFEEAVERLVERVQDGDTVLVHCHAGRSRSASVIISALAYLEGWTYDESRNYVSARRNIRPDETLVSHTKRYISENVGEIVMPPPEDQ